MTDYYLDSTDGADGNAGTSITGSGNWTGAKATLASAITAASASGDRIIVSDRHSETLTADTTYTVNANHTLDDPLQIICVTTADETVLAATGPSRASGNGEITTNTSSYWSFLGYVSFTRMRLILADTAGIFPFYGNVAATFIECLWERSGNQYMGIGGSSGTDGATVRLIGGELALTGGANAKVLCYTNGINTGASLQAWDLKITGAATTSAFSVYGNSVVELYSPDLTGLDSLDMLFSTQLDYHRLICIDPIMPASSLPTLLDSGDLTMIGHSEVTMVGAGANDNRNHIESYRDKGSILSTTSTYRTNANTYDGTNKYSLQITTNSGLHVGSPLRYHLATLDPGSLASKTVTVHILHDLGAGTPDDLTDADIWLECYVKAASGTTNLNKLQTPDPLATPTDHTNNTEGWTESLTAGHEVKQEITQSWGAGEATAGMLEVWVCVAKTMDGAGGGQLFICPTVEVA